MTDFKMLNALFFQELNLFFSGLGYKFRKTDGLFWKPFNSGKYINTISFFSRPGSKIQIRYRAFVRHDELEDLTEKLSKSRTPGTKIDFFGTIGGEVGNISQGFINEWEIADNEDIPTVVAQMQQAYSNIVLPFFEKYSSLEAVYQCAKEDTSLTRMLFTFEHEKAITAMVSASELGYFSEISTIRDYYIIKYANHSGNFNSEMVERVYSALISTSS